MTDRTENTNTPEPTTPRVEKPLVPTWRKKEPILLLDQSDSMNWGLTAQDPDGNTIKRRDLVKTALPLFVRALEAEDSEAATEQASGSDEEGGLLVHGFSSQHTELGDFNSSNFERRWNTVRFGGGTRIMPAWKAALADYMKEFGDATEPPVLETLIITDGEAADAAEFAGVLSEKHPDRYFGIAIIGFGRDHDNTLASYQAAAKNNPNHVAVLSFDSVTDPSELANDLIAMAGLGK